MDRADWQPEVLHNVAFGDLSDALPAMLTADQAYGLAAQRHGVSVAEMKGALRYRHIVAARHEAWRMLRGQGWSFPAIGYAANRDHTTVMAALRGHGERR